MSDIFQAPSIIEKLTTRKDNTIKLEVGVQELTPEEEAMLMRLRNKIGWFLFSEAPMKEEDIKDVKELLPEFKGEKSPSQRLRNVLWRLWEINGKKGDSNDFYRRQMEKLIEYIKEKLS